MDGLGERIKIAAVSVGGLDNLAPKLTDTSRRTLSDWANDKTEPRASSLLEIAQRTHISISWLVTGKGDMFDSTVTWANEDGVWLPFYDDINASAGAGYAVTSERQETVVAFARQFLRDQGAVPEKCSVIRARGDSMAPTIPDASLLVIDHSQNDITNGCIMVINVGDDLLVKRVRRRLDGLIDLLSDNPIYPPETIGPDMLQRLRIIGRVIYFCRTP